MIQLGAVEGRVVGSLIEKQLTTPQQYPLSLNSLTLACNQTSNRDPVVSYSETEVQSALDSLKSKGLVRFVLPSHGRSVVRYRHVLDEKLALDARQLSLVGVLVLRGPQTVGELRTRTERMAEFDGLREVESDLEGLSRWEEPLVARLPRRPGQKEERWTQLLCEAVEGAVVEGPGDRATAAPPASQTAAPPPSQTPAPPASQTAAPPVTPTVWARPASSLGDGLAELRSEVAELREEVSSLREELTELRRELGE